MEEYATQPPSMKKRIHKKRKNGLFNPDAPFWKGERAEDIVAARVAQYKKKRARKTKKK